MAERWKAIEDFEDYSVSNLGRVKRTTPDTLGRACRILKANSLKKGYLQVGLYREGKVHPKLVHTLVAEAFIPNPKKLSQVNHLGRNDDCRAHMLEWRSAAGNMLHAVQTGRKGKGVCFNKKQKRWVAYMHPNGKRKHLGSFATRADAVQVRSKAVKELLHII